LAGESLSGGISEEKDLKHVFVNQLLSCCQWHYSTAGLVPTSSQSR